MRPFDLDPQCWVVEQIELLRIQLSGLSKSGACGEGVIHQALDYTLLSGGKLLRGLLVSAATNDIAKIKGLFKLDDTLSFSAAIECLHAASLVHDDLPGLDNDDFRRGVASCHKKFGEGVAILIGDLLVALAFECVAKSAFQGDVREKLQRILAESWKKLCVGQILDVSESKERKVGKIIEYKTGALFEAACAGAAVCAGLTPEQVSKWSDWGLELGVLFQKVDNYLDGDAGESDAQQLLSELVTIKDSLPLTIEKSHSAVLHLIESLIVRSLDGVARDAH